LQEVQRPPICSARQRPTRSFILTVSCRSSPNKLVDGKAPGTKDLIIGNVLSSFLDAIDNLTGNQFDIFDNQGATGTMRVLDFDRGGGSAFYGEPGDLGLSFTDFDPFSVVTALAPFVKGVSIAQSVFQAFSAIAYATSATIITLELQRQAKALRWVDDNDPLIIDLDGDGIETIALGDSRAYFDVDGDLFRERTGWLKGDDGFLVLDGNGNGRIDDASELFGDATQGGYAELAGYDSNGDGKISVGDLVWSELKVWQDKDGDGESDAGELASLEQLGIRELGLGTTALDATTPQGTQLLSYGAVTFDNGRVSTMYEAIFASNDTDTKYAGEAGRAPWQSAATLNAKGFGTITDLAVAAANDVGLAELAQSRAAAMTSPKLRTLVAQAGDVLGAWGMTFRDCNSKSADFYFSCRIFSAMSGVERICRGGRLGGCRRGGCGMSKSNAVRSGQMLTCKRTSEPGDRDAAARNDNDVSAQPAREVM
jgi:hypothetical protein